MNTQIALAEIFNIDNPSDLEYELRHYLARKRRKLGIPLTLPEQIFEELVLMGGRIAGDGFVSIYSDWFTPESFAKAANALTEVGGVKPRDLLREAWDIYTKGKELVSVDELRAISVRRFNSKEKMDRFEQIGEEVVAEIQAQYAHKKVWSVEYAKRHYGEFEPIKA